MPIIWDILVCYVRDYTILRCVRAHAVYVCVCRWCVLCDECVCSVVLCGEYVRVMYIYVHGMFLTPAKLMELCFYSQFT